MRRLGKISDFLFTGVMVQIVENMAGGSEKLVNASSIIVIVTEIIAAVVCFSCDIPQERI